MNWWLTDHCNYDCSYCPDELKRGHIPLIDLRDAKSFLTEVKKHASNIGKTPQIELTGGEITEWSHLIDLLEFSRSLGMRNLVRTNCSRDVGYYQKLFALIDGVDLIYHPEYTQKSHIILLTNMASVYESLNTHIVLNCSPEYWDQCNDIKDFVDNKWPHITATMRMLFKDPIKNTTPLEQYSKEQKITFENQSGDLMFEDDYGNITSTDYQSMILANKNIFTSANCMIGIEQIIVDAWGRVYKGHCRQGRCIGSIDTKVDFPENPQVCNRPSCPNSFDIQATKFS